MTTLRLALPLGLPLVLAGCLSFGAKPPPSLLALTPAQTIPVGEARTASANSISVGIPSVAQEAASQRVPVRATDTSVAYIKDAQWVEPPNRLFTRLLVDVLSARTGRLVVGPRGYRAGANRLDGDLKMFGVDAATREAVVTFDATFAELAKEWPTIDFVVHAIGFSDKSQLRGKFYDTTLDNFLMTMNISAYSFVAVAKRAREMMPNGGSLLTLSYYGAEKVIPHYNVMGVAKAALETSVKYLAVDLGPEAIRVNGISAGPIQTLAARGIGDFNYILKWNELNSPLRRNVTIEDVGGAGLYLLSDLASGVTGEVHHVDAGYNVIGMKAEDAPDIALDKG